MSRVDTVEAKAELKNDLFSAGPLGLHYESELKEKLSENDYMKPALMELLWSGKAEIRDLDGDKYFIGTESGEPPENHQEVVDAQKIELPYYRIQGESVETIDEQVLEEHYSQNYDIEKPDNIDEGWKGLIATTESSSGNREEKHYWLWDDEKQKVEFRVENIWKIPEWAENKEEFVFEDREDRLDYINSILNYNSEHPGNINRVGVLLERTRERNSISLEELEA